MRLLYLRTRAREKIKKEKKTNTIPTRPKHTKNTEPIILKVIKS